MRFRFRRDRPEEPAGSAPEEPDGSAEPGDSEAEEPDGQSLEGPYDHEADAALEDDPLGIDDEPIVVHAHERSRYSLDALGLALDDDPGLDNDDLGAELPEEDDGRGAEARHVEHLDGAVALVLDRDGSEVLARVRRLPGTDALIADELAPDGRSIVRVFDPAGIVRVLDG